MLLGIFNSVAVSSYFKNINLYFSAIFVDLLILLKF